MNGRYQPVTIRKPAPAIPHTGRHMPPSRRPLQFTALANARGVTDPAAIVDAVLTRARRAESEGWDMLGYADFAIGDPFPMLAVLARETTSIPLMTRIAGVAIRSAPLMASGAAWIDRLSDGRFTLGLGASSEKVVVTRHGMDFSRPARRMEESLTLIRALLGHDTPGPVREQEGWRYEGEIVRLQRALTDITPVRPVPVILAASGPRMLRIAGALAEGVLVELATPEFVHWAWGQIREGAALAGRTLPEDFVFMYQTQVSVQSDEPRERARTAATLDFLVSHMLQKDFDHMWKGGGCWDLALDVRALCAAGERERATRQVEAVLLPRMAIVGQRAELPERTRTWMAQMHTAGVTMLTMQLEMDEILGVTLAQARTWAAEIAAQGGT